MKKRPTILVVCAAGAATSALTASRLRDGLKDRKFDADVSTGTISDLARAISLGVDIVVTPTVLSAKTDVPIINTTAFLTNRGVEEALDKVIEKLNE